MSLFVAKLAPRVSQSSLRKLFESYGEITRISIRRNYAFVDFADKRAAEEAMEKLQGLLLLSFI